MPGPQSVTSSDVGRRAGVSQATVSAVLNGARSNIRVSEATRQRVIAAATELGYTPHLAAQALRRQRSGVIGFVPRFFRQTPYERPIPYLLSGHIARAAMLRGYHIIEVNAESDQARTSDELIRFLLGQRVDGVIFDAPGSVEEVRRFIDRGVPVVQLLRPQQVVEASTITVDASCGINSAVDHLVGLGHRAIAFIGSSRTDPVDRSRLDAFLAALDRHAIPLPDGYLHLGTTRAVDGGYQATQSLLACAERPTALIAMGDSLALGALRALYERSIRVPDGMSIVSYDDAFAAFLYPPLTSVAQPVQAVAEHAIAVLAERLDGDEVKVHTPVHLVLRTGLVVRASTHAPLCR
ncbi:MAG: LacI family transcriptional regulator [Chloroflexota bacterium]|nr:LacI family transcriptional regulator [Chloroflexota bacterium]